MTRSCATSRMRFGRTQKCYTCSVKNITVSVDEQARAKAAERDTSLSALVRRFLVELVSEESAERGLERRERDLRAQIGNFSAGDRLPREDAHNRSE
jgi:predicted ArsR family transcriptional regulator